MSKDEKQPAPASGASQREPIPVRRLKFMSGDNVDIPGKQAATSATTTVDPKPGHERWVCEFLPWYRMFQITYYPAGGGQPESMRLDPRLATWWV